MSLRDLIQSLRITRSRSCAAAGRFADVHMWTIRDGWTSRAQAFRDETGGTFMVITRRDGDTGPGHINGAEMFRADAWAQFFADEPRPPILIANVLDPIFLFDEPPQIVTLHFDADGIFDYHHTTDTTLLQNLNRLGAEWDEGTGFLPPIPSSPRYAHVWRRFPVEHLPQRHLFRNMAQFMTVDWGKAVKVAIEAIQDDGQISGEVAPSIAAAARTLLYEPIELGREPDRVWYVNGQHRTEAMLRQGVRETVLRDTRLIAEPPMPGEIGPAGVS